MAFVTIHYRQPGRLGRLYTLAAWASALVVLTKYLELAWLVLAGVVGGVVSWFLSRYITVRTTRSSATRIMKRAGATFPRTALTTPLLKWRTEWYVCIGVPLFLLIFLIGASFFVGWSSRSQRVNDEDREWWARLGAWVIISILAWVVSCALVIFGPDCAPVVSNHLGVSGRRVRPHRAHCRAQRKITGDEQGRGATRQGSCVDEQSLASPGTHLPRSFSRRSFARDDRSDSGARHLWPTHRRGPNPPPEESWPRKPHL